MCKDSRCLCMQPSLLENLSWNRSARFVVISAILGNFRAGGIGVGPVFVPRVKNST